MTKRTESTKISHTQFKSQPVPVGGVVTHPTAGSEPDMKLSLHPAPEYTG